MKNLLSALSAKAAQSISLKKYQDSLPEFKDESNEIKDPEAKKKYKETLDNAKEDMKKRGEEMLDKANEKLGQMYNQMIEDFNELGQDLGHLSVGTAQFAARIAMVPPALISVTPMGPGVSAQLAPPLLQQLKAEGDNLSAVYDRVDAKVSKLGLKSLMGTIPVVGSVMSIVETTQAVAKPLIALVGANVGDIIDDLPIPEIEIPIPIPDLSAANCSAFSPKDLDLTNISASNCSKFVALNDDNPTVKCNNCKNYKSRL